METDIQKKRIDAYRAASLSIKDLYGSLELGDVLKSFSRRLNLSSEKHDDFINLVGDFILGLISQDSIENTLTVEYNAENYVVGDIISAVQKFLLGEFVDSSTILTPSSDVKEELELRPEGVPAGAPALEAEQGIIENKDTTPISTLPEAPKDLKEELELRPEGVPGGAPAPDVAQPLTRDAVLRALSPSRTMAQDIASLQHSADSDQQK